MTQRSATPVYQTIRSHASKWISRRSDSSLSERPASSSNLPIRFFCFRTQHLPLPTKRRSQWYQHKGQPSTMRWTPAMLMWVSRTGRCDVTRCLYHCCSDFLRKRLESELCRLQNCRGSRWNHTLNTERIFSNRALRLERSVVERCVLAVRWRFLF
jgi:hypothetical protein